MLSINFQERSCLIMKKFLIKAISSVAISVLSISFTVNAMKSSTQTDSTDPTPVNTTIINKVFADERAMHQFDDPWKDFTMNNTLIEKYLEETREIYTKAKEYAPTIQGKRNFQIIELSNAS